MEKILHIIGGANGSGKSTLAEAIIHETGLPFLNPDLIAKEIAPDAIDTVKMQTGKEYQRRLKEYFAEQKSFVIESTLAGHNIAKIIQDAHQLGYHVEISYIFLAHSNDCISRVKCRVQNGGHNVPIEDIARRYYRSIENFWDFYKDQVERWNVFFNGFTYQPILVATQNQTFSPPLLERLMNILRIWRERSYE